MLYPSLFIPLNEKKKMAEGLDLRHGEPGWLSEVAVRRLLTLMEVQ